MIESFAQQTTDFLMTGGSGSLLEPSLLGTISHVINMIALALMASLFVVGAATFVIQTANKGTPGGQVISSFWMPIRIVAAVILLIPLSSGYSTIQFGVLRVADAGTSAANKVMTEGLEFIYQEGAYMPAAVADPHAMLSGWVTSEVCLQYMNMSTRREAVSTRVRSSNEEGLEWRSISYDYNEAGNGPDVHDPRIGYCGSLRVRMPDSERADALINTMLAHQPSVAAIAARIIADESSLQTMLDQGVSAQSAYESAHEAVGTELSGSKDDLVSLEARYKKAIAAAITAAIAEKEKEYGKDGWVNEITARGWPALGTVFWHIQKRQQEINDLAAALVATYQPPRIDDEWTNDERFRAISKRLRGVEKAYVETRKDSADFNDVVIMSVANSGADDGSADGIKRMFAHTGTNIGKALTVGDANGDLLVRMQYAGSVIGTSAEATWWLITAATATAEALKESTSFAAANLANSVAQTPIIGPLLGGGASLAGTATVFAASTSAGLITKGAALFQGLLYPLMLVGLVLAVVLPTIPLFLWFMGWVSWMLFFLECLLVSPFWLAAHGTAEKEGWGTEHTRQGYMLMIGLFLSPVLRVAGFFAVILALRPLGTVIQWGFDYTAGLIISGWMSPLLLVAGSILSAFLAYTLIVRVFALPHELFERGLRWINGGNEVTGDGASADKLNVALISAGGRAEGIGQNAAARPSGFKPSPTSPAKAASKGGALS